MPRFCSAWAVPALLGSAAFSQSERACEMRPEAAAALQKFETESRGVPYPRRMASQRALIEDLIQR